MMSDSTTDVPLPESSGNSEGVEAIPEALDASEKVDELPTLDELDSLVELRNLILGQELDSRFERYRVNSENVAEVLPQALALTRSQELVAAARPTVENAIKASVSQEQEILADALFPIIGPATRKAVTTAIKTLVDSFNQGLELSLSPKSIRWRIESWRTGRPFAEVVLLRTLLFQVEQVLLIHKKTGLMLNDVVAETVTVQDPDLVSSMLTAIEDFVKDSFSTNSDSFLDSVEFGDLTLWIEEGPQAVLACAIRGVAPQSLRPQMQQTLETIHHQYDRQLENFSGDRAPFETSRAHLQDCLLSQAKTDEKKRSPLLWIIGVLLIGLLILFARQMYLQYQWKSALQSLEQEPGITVLNSKRGWTRSEVQGLRDPLAPDPRDIIQNSGVKSDRVTLNFEPYWSLSPQLMENHARTVLSPPAGVFLQYDPKTLTIAATGKASYDWIERANQFPQSQPRVERIDTSQLDVLESEKLQRLVQTLETTVLEFREGSSALEPEEMGDFEQAATTVRELTTLASQIRQPLMIHIVGQATASGQYEDNARLSQSRADLIMRRLTQMGIPAQYLKAEGIGVKSEFVQKTAMQKAQVSFQVDRPQP